MAQYGWADCPAAVRAQITGFRDALIGTLANNLVGVYLHGSLAMGCFNPELSDIDVLTVTRQRMPVETKRRVVELLLRYSAAPRPFEISILGVQDLHPWQHPTPFDLHYGEDGREKFQHALASGDWQSWNDAHLTDPDLAAHVTITRHRGLCLHGAPIAELFPLVPPEHYRDSILSDFEWGYERLDQFPIYFILNACRIHAYVCEGRICSKDESGAWAISNLPEEFRKIVRWALDAYRGSNPTQGFATQELEPFAAYMRERLPMRPNP